jgi:hypothetical protein
MAAYFFQGVYEYVFPGHPLPSIIEPMGAVPKKGPDEFRHLADERRGNKWLADWGVRYYSAHDLAFALSWRAIVNGHDINDGYHIGVLAGCTGQLVWGCGIVRVECVYLGDADFEPPVEESADSSFQPAPGQHSPRVWFVLSGACTWAAGLPTAPRGAISPRRACSSTAAYAAGPSRTLAKSPPAAR